MRLLWGEGMTTFFRLLLVTLPLFAVPASAQAPLNLGLLVICTQLKDPDQNGSRSLDDLVTHVTNDPLVIWAWAPGKGRRPPPGTHAAFAALIRAWAETGAECPRVP